MSSASANIEVHGGQDEDEKDERDAIRCTKPGSAAIAASLDRCKKPG